MLRIDYLRYLQVNCTLCIRFVRYHNSAIFYNNRATSVLLITQYLIALSNLRVAIVHVGLVSDVLQMSSFFIN